MDDALINAIVQQALEHAWDMNIPSPPDFDQALYLRNFPDVAEALNTGALKSAFVHYVLVGRNEGRPRPTK